MLTSPHEHPRQLRSRATNLCQPWAAKKHKQKRAHTHRKEPTCGEMDGDMAPLLRQACLPIVYAHPIWDPLPGNCSDHVFFFLCLSYFSIKYPGPSPPFLLYHRVSVVYGGKTRHKLKREICLRFEGANIQPSEELMDVSVPENEWVSHDGGCDCECVCAIGMR